MFILCKLWLLGAIALSGVNAAQKTTPEVDPAFSMCRTSQVCMHKNFKHCTAYTQLATEFKQEHKSLEEEKARLDVRIKRLSRDLQTIAELVSQANTTGLIPCKR